MEPVLQEGLDILGLAFSSGLSTTYQSAAIAAQELQAAYPERRIHVVDTCSASLGLDLLAWHSCQKRDSGMDLEALTQWVEARKLKSLPLVYRG